MGQQQHLEGDQAVAKLREIVKHNATCMFHTRTLLLPMDTRPMMVQEVDDAGALWFFTSRSGEAAQHIQEDQRVMFTITDNGHSEYLVVNGDAELVDDNAKKEELWSAFLKAWFPNGVNDPDLALLKVMPTESRYWDTTNGKVLQLMKIAGAVITGKPNDSGGVNGKLEV